MSVLRIALPTPLRKLFDYLPPADCDIQQLQPGVRVFVNFGRRKMLGVLVTVVNESEFPRDKLKSVIKIIDSEPVFSDTLFVLLQWAANYYQHSFGETFFTALPSMLREDRPAKLNQYKTHWCLTELGRKISITELSRAPKQRRVLLLLREQNTSLTTEQCLVLDITSSILQALIKKQLIVKEEIEDTIEHAVAELVIKPSPVVLNVEQQEALDSIKQSIDDFKVWLLYGVTGSGKTEVYLQVIAEVLRAGKQALVLIPEIALTPQTVARFSERFMTKIVVFHSKLSQTEKFKGWLAAREGTAKIIIGTRSAVFTPMQNPGIIIIDEAHDTSFKQQNGLRYSARNLAVLRAQREKMPIILGSATPTLESLYNADNKQYQMLRLRKRAGKAIPPTFTVVDMRQQKLSGGLAAELLTLVGEHLQREGQVLLFLNQRGFAPVLMCHGCGWFASCRRCDAKMVFHKRLHELRCHHCDRREAVVPRCPDCQAEQIMPVGMGTERLQQTIMAHFPNYKVARIDRDSTQRKGEMEALLDGARDGKFQILIGTQMLAKGHHFPGVTLVGIVNADGGLLSADFRATERFAQLVLQVAGRAGRVERVGEVAIQTHQPQHPLLQLLLNKGYLAFTNALLEERKLAAMPPYSHLALLRAEAPNSQAPLAFLQQISLQARSLIKNTDSHVHVLGPAPAPIERVAGKYRAQLLLQSPQRKSLQILLSQLISLISNDKLSKQVRWSIDVDPIDMV